MVGGAPERAEHRPPPYPRTLQAAGETKLTGKSNREPIVVLALERGGFRGEGKRNYTGNGALGRGDHMEMLQWEPWLSPGEAQARAGTGLGGAQLTFRALAAEPHCRAFFLSW